MLRVPFSTGRNTTQPRRPQNLSLRCLVGHLSSREIVGQIESIFCIPEETFIPLLDTALAFSLTMLVVVTVVTQ